MEELTIAGAGSISVLIYLLCQLPAIAGALLLARYLRGDLEEYPPFLWK